MNSETRKKDDGTKGYRLASMIYDPVLEPGLRVVREKVLEISGVKTGESVVEVCSGTGRQAELFALAGAKVTGVEISDFMIAKARKKETDNLVFAQCDATKIEFEDSTFDIASTGFSLHEVTEEVRDGFLKEMIRLTKPGGRMIFADFSVQTRKGFKRSMAKSVGDLLEWLAGKEHYRLYAEWMKKGGLAGYLDGKGIRVEKTIPLNGGHTLIVKALNLK